MELGSEGVSVEQLESEGVSVEQMGSESQGGTTGV